MEIRIGDLAKRSGCEVVPIRYYEKEASRAPTGRRRVRPPKCRALSERLPGANFRLYGEAHIERLQFIRHCRSLDMTLSEIRALLGLRDNPMQDCGEVITLLEAHIQQVEMRVSALLQLKRFHRTRRRSFNRNSACCCRSHR